MLRFQQVWEGEKETWWVLLCPVGNSWYKNSCGEKRPEWATQVLREESHGQEHKKDSSSPACGECLVCTVFICVHMEACCTYTRTCIHIPIYVYGCWYSESILLGLCSSSPPGTAELKAVEVIARNKCDLAEAMPFLPAYVWDQRLGGDPVSHSPLQVVKQTWLLPAFHPVAIRDKSAEKHQPVLADSYIQLLKQSKP